MKILVLTSRFPYPLEKGDKLRIYHQLKEISKHHELILISLCLKDPSAADIKHLDQLVSKQHIFKVNMLARSFSLFKALFHGGPIQNAYFYSSAIKKKIKDIIEEERPDFIHCHLIRMVDYIGESKTKKSLDYMDSYSAGALKRMENSKGLERMFFKREAKRTDKFEQEAFSIFDQHYIISEQDRDTLKMRDKQNIAILRNGIDTSYFEPRDQKANFDLGFIGNLGYYSNVYGVNFILDELMPRLDEEMKVLIAGARPSKHLLNRQSDRLTIKPWMEDIRDAYADIDIFIAPLFKGVGQQNKILEAMSMGVPVICTTAVNNAIQAKPEKEILIANTPEEFVNQITRLKSDPNLRNDIRLQAKKLVDENFSWAAQTAPLLDFFKT